MLSKMFLSVFTIITLRQQLYLNKNTDYNIVEDECFFYFMWVPVDELDEE